MKRRPPPFPAGRPALPARGRSARGQGRAPLIADPEARNGFMRGFIAAGLVAASGRPVRRETLRLALRGGTTMAAGIAGANAIDRRDYVSALFAVAAGALGLSAIDYLFPEPPSNMKEVSHEQEKA